MGSNGILVDPEIQGLIPAATDDELAGLEEALKREGCRDSLVVWKEQHTLLDGHTRRRFCEKLGIGYRTTEMSFPDRESAMIWVLDNQGGRRNSTDMQKVENKQKRASLISALAKANQAKTQFSANPTVRSNSSSPSPSIKLTKVIADESGVGESTVKQIVSIQKNAVPELAEMARTGKVSVNAAAVVAKLPLRKQAAAAKAGPEGVKAAAKEARKEPAKPEPEEAQIDENGTKLIDREGMIEAFAALPMFDEILNHFTAITKLVNKIGESSGRYIRHNQFEIDLKNARGTIVTGRPFAVCPYCRGTGDHGPMKCGGCKGCGWVAKSTYNNAPSEMRV